MVYMYDTITANIKKPICIDNPIFSDEAETYKIYYYEDNYMFKKINDKIEVIFKNDMKDIGNKISITYFIKNKHILEVKNYKHYNNFMVNVYDMDFNLIKAPQHYSFHNAKFIYDDIINYNNNLYYIDSDGQIVLLKSNVSEDDIETLERWTNYKYIINGNTYYLPSK